MAGDYRMYRCGACRTAFVHPMPDDELLTQFYAKFHLSDTAGGTYDQVEQRMQADFPAKVRLVQRACGGRPGRLLDVGCGKGFFVRACRDQGIDAEGIDLSRSGADYATEQLGVKATCGALAAHRDTLGLFDVVTFWATIEHLRDPIGMLRDIHGVLRPGGVLLADTGIGDDWLDRLLPGSVQWYDPPQHLFVFSANGLRRGLEQAGFAVQTLDRCVERSATRRLLKILRNGITATGLRTAAEVGRMRNGAFSFTRFPMGNLMLAIARKPRSDGSAR